MATTPLTHNRWTRTFAVVLFVLLLLLLLSGCGAGENPGSAAAPAGEAPTNAAALTAGDSAAVATGSAAAARLAAGLMGPLGAAIQASDAAGAIDFCSREALALTAAIQDSVGGGVTLRRTTLKPRNPANAPDSLDVLVLEELHTLDQQGDSLPAYVLRTAGAVTRFYRPLRIQPLCINCHGPDETLDGAVVRVLRERYPADRATGYREGDLRGVIRVDVPAGG